MAFVPHGSHEVRIEGRIMVVRTGGPWNTEEVAAYAREQKANVRILQVAPWVVLGYVYGTGVHTPDAFRAMIATVRQHRSVGRSGTAVLLEDSVESPQLVRERFELIYDTAGEPCAFFDDPAPAREWLAERLAAADTD